MRYLVGFMACVILGGCVVMFATGDGRVEGTVDLQKETTVPITRPGVPGVPSRQPTKETK